MHKQEVRRTRHLNRALHKKALEVAVARGLIKGNSKHLSGRNIKRGDLNRLKRDIIMNEPEFESLRGSPSFSPQKSFTE